MMRVDTIDGLANALIELYPGTFTEAQRPAFVDRYRSILGNLTGDELNAAYHRTFETWTKRAAPQAADILAAHRSTASKGQMTGKHFARTEDFMASLHKRDQALRDERQRLISEFEAAHAKGYQTAQEEGWRGMLESQVKVAANILAQRNQARSAGADVPPMKAEDYETYQISVIDGEERIEISQARMKVWRGYAMNPSADFLKYARNLGNAAKHVVQTQTTEQS